MCNSKQEPVFITMWVLLFIDLALNLMGYYVGTLSQHSELRSQTLALCHCLLVKKFKSFKKLNYPQGKDL